MTVVERLEAAIAKLEWLKAKSTPGEWYAPESAASVWAGAGLSSDLLVVDDARFLGDADLIVTLHRTIDAQIAVLRVGSEFALITSNRWTDISVALADAILGDDYTLTTEEAKL